MTQDPRTLNILIIDNEPTDIVALLKDSLKLDCHSVATSHDAEVALRNRPWDLILCAFETSFPNPFQLAQAVQPQTPFIFVADHATVRDAVDMMRLGARAFVEKRDRQHLIEIITQELASTPQINAALWDSEARYRLLAENMVDVIWVMDINTMRFTYVSPSVKALRGYTPEEVMSRPFNKALSPNSWAAIEKSIPGRIQGFMAGEPGAVTQRYEVEQECKDGSTIWTEVVTTLIQDSTGAIQVLGVTRDLTERKQAEAALRASEEKHRSLVESSDAAISVFDIEGGVLFANKIAAQPLGYEPEALIGKNITDLFPVGRATHQLRTIRDVIQTGTGVVNEAPTWIAGEERWYRTSIQPVRDASGEITSALVHADDITRFKAAEAAVRQSEAQLQALVNSQTNYVIRTDLEGYYVYWNRKFEEEFGWIYEKTGLAHSYALDSICDYHHQRVREVVEQCVLEPGKIIKAEIDKPRKEGGVRTTLWEFVCLLDDYGVPNELQCMGIDISDRVLAEQSLRESEQRYRQMFELVQLPKLLIDPQTGKILDANPAAVIYYGYPHQQLVTMDVSQIHASPPEIIFEKLAMMMQGEISSCIYEQRMANGNVRLVEGFPATIELGGQQVICCTYIDVTDRHMAQVALQKMNENLEQRVIERTAELERTTDRIEAIFNHSGDGILLLDVTKGIQQANYTFCEMFGVTDDSYLGQKLSAYFQPDDNSDLNIIVEEVAAWHQMRHIQARVKGANSAHIDVEISLAPVNRSNEAVTNLVCIIRDISERKRLEYVLTEQLAELDRFFTVALDLLSIADTDGHFIKVNKAWESTLGYSVEDLEGHSFLDLVHPDDLQMTKDALDQLLSQKQVINFINRYRARDGSYRYVEWRSNPHGNIVYSAARDITERKRMEDELRESEERYRATIAAMSEGLVVQNLDGKVQFCNEAAQRILGLTAEEMIGRSSIDLGWQVIRDDGTPFPSEMYPAIATLRTGEAQSNVIMGVYKSDGALVWILASSRFLLEQRQGYALVTTFTDITELKRAEAQLQEKHQEGLEMQAYLKALHEITIKLTRTQTLDDFYRCTVEQALEHLGFERIGFFLAAPDGFAQGTYGTDVQGHLVDEHHFRSKLSDMSDIMQRTLNRRERFAFDEDAPLFENLKPVAKGLNAAAALWDGEILGWLTVDNAIHHQPISKLQLDILSLYAITVGTLLARKQAEEKTLLVSQRLELATHAGGIGIWDWHIIDNQMIWDERMGAIYGVNAEERSAITDRWYKLIHPDDQTRVIAEIAAALYQTPPFICEYRIVRRDGETRYIQSSAVVLHAENGAVERMVGVNLDVTDIKAAEQMLRSALEKEKELGELKSRFVSTASHEFRTPLAAILATTETLTYYRHRMDDAQIEARLEKIRQQVNHMKNIMENVLQLSRIQTGRIEFNPVSSDLDDLCRSIVEEFQSRSEYRERIVYTCLDTPVIVCMDLQLMRQIISNLVSNALKYSPSDKLIQIKLSREAGRAICRVSDEGIGIPVGDLPRLFEPFHRGANVGAISGTGLGLSITKEAVEKHGGTLSVESEVGKGTTFTVMIPLACNENEATHD